MLVTRYAELPLERRLRSEPKMDYYIRKTLKTKTSVKPEKVSFERSSYVLAYMTKK